MKIQKGRVFLAVCLLLLSGCKKQLPITASESTPPTKEVGVFAESISRLEETPGIEKAVTTTSASEASATETIASNAKQPSTEPTAPAKDSATEKTTLPTTPLIPSSTTEASTISSPKWTEETVVTEATKETTPETTVPPTTIPPSTEPSTTAPSETVPPATETEPTEPASTEPITEETVATEPPAEDIDTAALESYGRSYASSAYGYNGTSACHPGSGAGYFPAATKEITSMEDGYWYVQQAIDSQYYRDIAYGYSPYEEIDGVIVRCPINVSVDSAGGNTYTITVYYGGTA